MSKVEEAAKAYQADLKYWDDCSMENFTAGARWVLEQAEKLAALSTDYQCIGHLDVNDLRALFQDPIRIDVEVKEGEIVKVEVSD